MEQCLGIPFLAHLLLGLLHVVVYFGESLKETVNQLSGFLAVDVEPFGQTEHRDAVDDAVGTLRLGALVAADVGDGLLVDG